MITRPSNRSETIHNKYQKLLCRIQDKRARKVVFLSHCILNENTRYPGGACRGGCIAEILSQCVEQDLGMVQMPCPEQIAWGGVTKQLLLMAYGAKGTALYTLRHILVPWILLYTKLVYGRIASQVTRQIQNYLDSEFSVQGVVGIDGSPTCGVKKTLDFKKSFEVLANIDIHTVTITDANKVVLECLINGKGLFIQALQRKLKLRKMDIRFLSHDLIAEMDGKSSAVIL